MALWDIDYKLKEFEKWQEELFDLLKQVTTPSCDGYLQVPEERSLLTSEGGGCKEESVSCLLSYFLMSFYFLGVFYLLGSLFPYEGSILCKIYIEKIWMLFSF